MAVRKKVQSAYGFGQGIYDLSPKPIVAQRAPTGNDFAEIGTTWVDQAAVATYVLNRIVNGQADWVTNGGGGANLTNLTVNPGPTDLTGDVTITSALNSTIDFSSGTGGASIDTSGVIDLTSTRSNADAINIAADGAAGGITLDANTGGLTVDSSGEISITSTVAAGGGNSIEIAATDADGKILIRSEGNVSNGITLLSNAGGIDILSAGGGAEDIRILNTGGSITMRATEVDANAVVIEATGGGVSGIQISTDDNQTALNIGTGGGVKTVEIGSNILASTLTLNTSGTTAGVKIDNGTQFASIFVGGATPEGSVIATRGCLFINAASASADTMLYVKTTTSGNTGWVALTST